MACLILVWAALQCFTTLICATNRAWNTAVHNWWRLPLKSMLILGITAGAVLLGMAVPVLMGMAEDWLCTVYNVGSWVYGIGGFVIPWWRRFSVCAHFTGSLRNGPRGLPTWGAALCVTVLLRSGESLFVVYLRDYAT